MLNARTVINIAIPGKKGSHHLFAKIWSLLSASIAPHVGIWGGTPKPKKERAASAKITLATLKEAITYTTALKTLETNKAVEFNILINIEDAFKYINEPLILDKEVA